MAEKSQTNATSAILHSPEQIIWGHIWKRTAVKSHTNATSVIMHPLMQVLWRHIWEPIPVYDSLILLFVNDLSINAWTPECVVHDTDPLKFTESHLFPPDGQLMVTRSGLFWPIYHKYAWNLSHFPFTCPLISVSACLPSRIKIHLPVFCVIDHVVIFVLCKYVLSGFLAFFD